MKSGFGRVTKILLSYLYKTGKYEIVEFCSGLQDGNPELTRLPWKARGTLPSNPQELENLSKDQNQLRAASYGAYSIDKVIQEEKPDIYLGVEDWWAQNYNIDKKWFDKITSVIWTTLDSLPILPEAVEKAPKVKNYWVWSNFAEKELHRLGHKHVKTVHGPVDDSKFFRLTDTQKQTLRRLFNIPKDAFIPIFVFRNQLRKSVPNLLEGYALWKQQNLEVKNTFLILHTHFGEGWDIKRLAAQYKVDMKEILTTYICLNCKSYEVKPFTAQNLDCRYCGVKGCSPNDHFKSGCGQVTTSIGFGVTEDQLNEIYNLADVYLHPFTSGGAELPLIESRFCELTCITTNYSCGEEALEDGVSLPLDWAKYTEHGTEFIKASTLPSSIAKQLKKFYNTSPEKRKEMGKVARKWVLENYSINSIGKQIEDFLDSCPVTTYDFSEKAEAKNANAVIPNIDNDDDWILMLYREILKMNLDKTDAGFRYWQDNLKNSTDKQKKRQEIHQYFQSVANQENVKINQIRFEDLLDKNDQKRVLVILPESIGDVFLSTSLLGSIRKRYPKPEWTIYFATKPENFEILDGNTNIDKVIPYVNEMDSLTWCEGIAGHKGFFDIAYPLHCGTQRFLNYLHNGVDTLDVELKDSSCT